MNSLNKNQKPMILEIVQILSGHPIILTALACFFCVSVSTVEISAASAGAILGNLVERGMIDEYDYAMIASALSDKAYSAIPQEYRDPLRAAILKNMLVTHVMMK